MSRSLGIDLSTDPKSTFLCSVSWPPEKSRVISLEQPSSREAQIEEMVEEIAAHDYVGIDAPFGWPRDFVGTVAMWEERARWSSGGDRRNLRLRATDRLVADRLLINPLSPSTDRIGSTAMHCAHLLDAVRLHRRKRRVDKTGDTSGVYEVYPAASLRASACSEDEWKKWKGYKTGKSQVKVRRRIVDKIAVELPELEIPRELGDIMIKVDHALDAFICALTARAAYLRLTVPPSGREERELARLEGWIHLPEDKATISRLVG